MNYAQLARTKGSSSALHAANLSGAASKATKGGTAAKASQVGIRGLGVIVTGTTDLSRDELNDMVIRNGGSVKKSVSSKVDLAVVGLAPGPAKVAKFAQLGIRQVTEAEFLDIIAGRNPGSVSNGRQDGGDSGGGGRVEARYTEESSDVTRVARRPTLG